MPVHLIASCHLCGKPIDTDADCWRAEVWRPNRVHVLCLAARMLMGEEPSRLDHEIAEDVNEAADELSDALCQNPGHAHLSAERN